MPPADPRVQQLLLTCSPALPGAGGTSKWVLRLAPTTAFDKWNGEKWVTDSDAQRTAAVSESEAEKAARISEANNTTQAWQTQLRLDIITDADKASLTVWMKYVQAVQAIDTAAPDIAWPEKPE